MPFIVPVIAVIGGAVLTAWGADRIIRQDDSADEKAKKIIKNLPSHIKKYVDRVDWNPQKGWMITFKTGTPQSVINEVKG